MKFTQIYNRIIIALFFFIAFGFKPLFADSKLQRMQEQQQEQMQETLEMMKNSGGVYPKQMQQMQGMTQFFINQGMRMEENKLNQELTEFDKKTSNNGNATVEFRDKVFKLKVTKCKIKNRENV